MKLSTVNFIVIVDFVSKENTRDGVRDTVNKSSLEKKNKALAA